MTFNDNQTKFLSELKTMLPLYQGSSDARLKAPATNLEWNVKKLNGEGGETIDGPTFAQRTQADLELIASTLAAGAAGQGFATHGAAQVGGIFGGSAASGAAAASAAPVGAQAAATDASPAASSAAAASPSSPVGAGGVATDVKALLTQKAADSHQKLDWKVSVVDLLALLGKDTSQSARHRYAVALGFPQDQIANMPSSEFNMWLHSQLMTTLAHNGGALPSNIA